jgi:pyridoxine 4-dehydrogenase
VDATRAAHAALAKRGIPLSTNQIQLSLLYKWPLENGLLDVCNELGVKVLAYSPLALGFLTGKYSATNLPTAARKSLGKKLFDTSNGEDAAALTKLLDTMGTIAAAHGPEVSLSQVALNWTRAKGTIPIPGARNLRQAKQNIDCLKWNLTPTEIAMLDEASSQVHSFLTPEQNPFPRKDINTGLQMYDS